MLYIYICKNVYICMCVCRDIYSEVKIAFIIARKEIM